MPNAFGGFDETPEMMAATLGEFARNGWLNIVGGCCGTTPAHIRAIAAAVADVPPRTRSRSPSRSRGSSGLEPLTLRPESNFIMIGERTNVTGSKKFARLILNGQFEQAVAVAREQVEAGANVIDVNMDEGMLDGEAAMTHFLNLIAAEPDVARVPIMVDSSKWSVIEAGLEMRAGQVDRQFDQPQGRGRAVPALRPAGPPLRRGGGGDGLRRAGAGRPKSTTRCGSPSGPTSC